ncbi:hypothetical protein ANTPLA_LOCUS6496 [Anthophora plagiata]
MGLQSVPYCSRENHGLQYLRVKIRQKFYVKLVCKWLTIKLKIMLQQFCRNCVKHPVHLKRVIRNEFKLQECTEV